MKEPRTVYEVLQMLEHYHCMRRSTYEDLAGQAIDPMAKILLEHLVELEDYSLNVVRIELGQLDQKHSTFLTSGPVLSREVSHAKDCRCDHQQSFQEALMCALTSDRWLDELLQRLEGCSAAPSVLHLAERLRDLEETKGIQIANFTRID
ncbi:hypothetical protein Mal15_18220 [Stieleria maiorica]|uniref:Ferritin/DPS protein domain-containing protein n=1 Tax=Stieleria maiorica TaxID=2795974 RepID=A0A5B9M9K8_9BACT|nr:hypothetical protein [Stieleria maiorica]QEF97778.1 hypothetical protein Mal15_18220 [Stieleria maiorica]